MPDETNSFGRIRLPNCTPATARPVLPVGREQRLVHAAFDRERDVRVERENEAQRPARAVRC